MLGSPGGRRRRLIQAFAPSNADNYYKSVPSSSTRSSSRRRQTHGKTDDVRKRPSGGTKSKNAIDTGFRPIDPQADHGYRIDVAKDGSMITAVPINDSEQPLRGGRGGSTFKTPQRPPRSSPILFSQPRSSPSASVNGSTTWSTQGLLDARGKQRHKMKRMRPATKNRTSNAKQSTKAHSKNDDFPSDPFNNVVHTARDKLKHAKGFLAFTGTNNNSHSTQQQPQQKVDKTARSRKAKVRWDLSPKRQGQPQHQLKPGLYNLNQNNSLDDMSFCSFPILSPDHKFDDSFVWGEEKKSSNDAISENVSKKDANMMPEKKDGTQPYEALLQQRMAEIQSHQKDLAVKISQKDVIKGTLITAIDGNLERNRKQMMALEEELKEIQWHLKLDSEKRHQRQQHQSERNHATTKAERLVPEVRLARSPSGAYDMESVEVGDPSITADTESVADLFRKGKAGRVTVTGLDPPARPSPPTFDQGTLHPFNRHERKEPDGSRISAVLRGEENLGFGNAGNTMKRSNDKARPMRIPSPPTSNSVSSPKHAQIRPLPERPSLRYQHNQPTRIKPPQPQNRAKFVHFNLPHESDSAELKFESTNSTGSPSIDNVDETNGIDDIEDISWKEEHFDVDAYNEETGSPITSEHHDIYQWTDKKHHVMVQEHYSREDHHHRWHHQEVPDETASRASSDNHNRHNGNRGVSSDSVETDPDLGFIHAVAAIVIQTAVRRFLAELSAAERMYAVDVIQTAVCNWMARKQNPYFTSGGVFHAEQLPDRIFHDEQNEEMFYDEQNHLIPQIRGPPQRTKRVMFEDDYNEFRDFAANEIQRCYRGWLARDGLEVDHFAATTIQRTFRGWWAREAMEVDRYCAVEIQRIVRGHLCRMSYIYDLYCIIVVQSVSRRYLAFYTSAVRLANILYIQAIYRGYRVREELRRYVQDGQEVAATFIQAQWRSYDARMNYINTLADILIVQSVARRWLVLRKLGGRISLKPKHDYMDDYEDHGQSDANYDKGSNIPTQRNTHSVWQQHRLNVVSGPLNPAPMAQDSRHTDDFDTFDQDSAGNNEWYDGNKSETSYMLKSWKGRKSK